MTTFEWLRARLVGGIDGPCVGERVEPLDRLRATEWSREFEELMRNRLIMGRFRYAPMRSADKGNYDNMGSAIQRLEKYIETGNLEHVVDAANLCMVEFEHGNHPLRHFAAVDDGEHTRKIR